VKLRVLWLLGLTACAGGADHERLGDAAYAKGVYPDALSEFRADALSNPSARVWAKVGLTALHTQSYREAAEAYHRLAKEDPSRVFEAVIGLGLTARGAERVNDAAALREAMVSLRALAPDHVSPREALGLVRGGKLSPAEAIQMYPSALAAAPDAGTVDGLLSDYGTALKATTDCEEAVRSYRAARRRSHDAKVRSSAGAGLADCGLQLGLEALSLNKADVAITWFREATSADSTSIAARRSRIGLGDAQIEQGDFVAAAIAYQGAISRDSTDSISHLAVQRLNAMGSAQAPVGPPADKEP